MAESPLNHLPRLSDCKEDLADSVDQNQMEDFHHEVGSSNVEPASTNESKSHQRVHSIFHYKELMVKFVCLR